MESGETSGEGQALKAMLVTERGRESRVKLLTREALYPSLALLNVAYVF